MEHKVSRRGGYNADSECGACRDGKAKLKVQSSIQPPVSLSYITTDTAEYYYESATRTHSIIIISTRTQHCALSYVQYNSHDTVDTDCMEVPTPKIRPRLYLS